MKLVIRKAKILKILLVMIVLIMLGNFLSIYLIFHTVGMDAKVTRLLIKLLNVNLESNLPTYFSALVLMADAFLLALIAYGRKSLGEVHWRWMCLSFVFVFISFDEMFQIHEQFRAPMEALFNTTGVFYFAWFIPYIAIMIVLGIAYYKFMMRLPKRILRLFIISAVIFVSGAVGMEAVGGMHAEVHGEETLTYAWMYSFEEFLEMTGGVIFLYALLSYIKVKFDTVLFTFQIKDV